jgi:lipoate-protein ligase B
MIIQLGLTDYETAYRSQMELVAKRKLGEIDDSVIITEHMPVFTLGRAGRKDNLLASNAALSEKGIKVLSVDRGGDITFHGPGQLVLYPIIDLKARGRDLHRYLRDLESVVISFLNTYGIIAERVKGKTGVWVGNKKIGSIGIGTSNWVTYHGASINIDVDLTYFSMINPCGLKDVTMTSLSEVIGYRVTTREAARTLIACFKRVFTINQEVLL